MSLISIIMPAYNAQYTIAQSIESILKQTHTEWELLVTDDNSTDTTKEIVLSYATKDKRIKYYLNDGVAGAWSARNNSLKYLSGEYVAFLDSDDTWESSKLALQLEAMLKSGVYASHTAYNRITSNGEVLGFKKAKKLVTYKNMLKKNEVGNLTGMYNVSKLGVIMQEPIGHEDYNMWLTILEKTDSIGVTTPLANYRVHSGSLSANKLKAAVWHFKILKKQECISSISILYYFLHYIISAVKSRV
ncbi:MULTISPECIES: glycosyltransferase family 2 protein [unclassified Pseudoalteromonas]|uniref:glycosyltransferase family 2 protein n=1 Tax=unclassified Pseudoalteromonas TaxID=194690 RepID=UPI000C07FAAD|nr:MULTISPECIES: glycosyltransferase family 2 protein [unclassified Pseudoalteromonas]MDP2636866.1 glycosyltransferase family 2 protein [Pseudoalteromonas sp. 1_MG-2023]PHN88684.1 glycosyl transferase family 2 [Pseudoalteromonas sp. 3D05]